MRPKSRSRARRVKAQRKFAQGAYVPPNAVVVGVGAAEIRREAAQDQRNVTRNNMTATGLLDVVSLQSHVHLTSQPVVIVERLRGRNPDRELPPPPQSEAFEPQPSDNPHELVNNMATIKKPADPPKLHTAKKKKEYKREHSMSLRSRRPSKLVNKVIYENCAPLGKVTSKRKKDSSDEDEPLIFKISRLKQTAKQTKQTQRSRDSDPKENIPNTPKTSTAKKIPKQRPPKVSTRKLNPPKEKSKKKPCKQRRANETTTNKIKTDETIAKIITTNESSAKVTAPRNAKQNIRRKKKNMKDKIHKKCSHKEPAHVSPEFSVPEFSVPSFSIPESPQHNFSVTVDIKEDSMDETVTQDNLVVVFAPIDPLTPDVLDDLVAPVFPVATEDPVVPPLPLIQEGSNIPMDNQEERSGRREEIDDEMVGFDSMECVGVLKHEELMLDDVPIENDDVLEVRNDNPEVTGDPDAPVNPSAPITRRLRIYSQEAGSSCMNDDIFTDCRINLDSEEHDLFLSKLLKNTVADLERARNVPFEVPTSCVAAQWRSDQDVINASQDLLDSRCKVCKPCIRVEKLMKVSFLLEHQIELTSRAPGNNAAYLENEPIERDGETEDLEMDNEDADSATDDQDQVYLLLPKHCCVMLKLRTSVVHGKKVLGVRLMARDGSRKNKQEFSLEEQEHLLDQLIETLTNTEQQSDKLEGNSGILESRRISISSDSTTETSDATNDRGTPIRLTAEKRKLKRFAVKKKLAEAELMHDRIREEKERQIARLEEEKRQEILRITAEKNIVVAEMTRYHERVTQMEKEKERDFARLKVEIRAEVISKIEANRRMYAEVDGMAANLAKEKDAKKMYPEELSDSDGPGTSSSYLTTDGGLLVDAPVYHPSEEDFRDPLRYYEKIWSEAVRYGICKVVPPPGWKPPFRVHDEMRFDVTNQYISRLFSRWGPAARELCAIKLSLAQQKVNFTRAPLLDGVEVNLPKLYHLVQRHGGLETVYNKKRWGKVAEDMKFNKGPNTERKLDQIYVKYLLPYDTLSHQERQDIMRKVEIAWNRKNQKLLDRAVNPLNRQKRLLGIIDSSDDETEDEDTVAAVNEAEDCIIKGAVMNRAKFKKIATMTYENTFGQASEAADPPELDKIEEYYWRLVTLGTEHVCVHTAAIDTGEEGYGFIKNKSDSYGRHPWNPKMVSQNPRNVLQYLGPVLGVTVPTLLLGMLFSTSCWHKDPHAVSWLEYQLLGPERIWYGIPAHQADNFRKAVETLCPTFCQNKGLWLPTDITMIPPNLLREHNVTLSRVTQRDGEYILAFPNAYTCCISTGYTESESVYFAPPSWLETLWTVFKEARESCEPTMFAMEHLLYNIGKDPKADHTILKIAQPLYDKMLREEVTNRQMLQERGLPFIQDLLSANSSRKKSKQHPYKPRDQDECEYCRATLYLSKVKGLTGRNTVLCLEHALTLLDTKKHKDRDVGQLQVMVHVSVKELNSVHDDMKRRLGMQVT